MAQGKRNKKGGSKTNNKKKGKNTKSSKQREETHKQNSANGNINGENGDLDFTMAAPSPVTKPDPELLPHGQELAVMGVGSEEKEGYDEDKVKKGHLEDTVGSAAGKHGRAAEKGNVNRDKEEEEESFLMVCSYCNKTNKTLKLCSRCKLIRYCDEECQRKHHRQHKDLCLRRANFLKSSEGDPRVQKDRKAIFLENLSNDSEECPICFLPLPIDELAQYMPCCGKRLCAGCVIRKGWAEMKTLKGHCGNDAITENIFGEDCLQEILNSSCPCCREPSYFEDGGRLLQLYEKRIQHHRDPYAMFELAGFNVNGIDVGTLEEDVEKDDLKALQLFLQAAELGNPLGALAVAKFIREGRAGMKPSEQNEKKYIEMAAQAGNVFAQYKLATLEFEQGNTEAAFFFLCFAASGGDKDALHSCKNLYKSGFLSKESLERTIRAHSNAQNATYSEIRDMVSTNLRNPMMEWLSS